MAARTDRDRQRQTETDRDRQRQTETDRDRQTDRQADRLTDWQSDRQTDSQTARQTDRPDRQSSKSNIYMVALQDHWSCNDMGWEGTGGQTHVMRFTFVFLFEVEYSLLHHSLNHTGRWTPPQPSYLVQPSSHDSAYAMSLATWSQHLHSKASREQQHM